MTYVDNLHSLSQHARNVLKECWEKRNSKGEIAMPEGKTGLYIKSIKQLTALHIWTKEIATSHGTCLLEVTMKEIRIKTNEQKN